MKCYLFPYCRQGQKFYLIYLINSISTRNSDVFVTDSDGKILSFNNLDEAKKSSHLLCPDMFIEEIGFFIQFDPIIEWVNGESYKIPAIKQLDYVWNYLFYPMISTYDNIDKEILDLLVKHRTTLSKFINICLTCSDNELDSLNLSKEILISLKELIASEIRFFDEHTKIIY